MLHFFKQRNLTNGSTRNTFIFLLKSNLLQRDGFIRYTVTCLVNDAVCSFTNLLHLFVLQNQNSQNQNRSVLKLKMDALNLLGPWRRKGRRRRRRMTQSKVKRVCWSEIEDLRKWRERYIKVIVKWDSRRDSSLSHSFLFRFFSFCFPSIICFHYT